jgi:hypothetical protein
VELFVEIFTIGVTRVKYVHRFVPALVLNVELQFAFIVKPLEFGFIEVRHHKEFRIDQFSNEIAV